MARRRRAIDRGLVQRAFGLWCGATQLSSGRAVCRLPRLVMSFGENAEDWTTYWLQDHSDAFTARAITFLRGGH